MSVQINLNLRYCRNTSTKTDICRQNLVNLTNKNVIKRAHQLSDNYARTDGQTRVQDSKHLHYSHLLIRVGFNSCCLSSMNEELKLYLTLFGCFYLTVNHSLINQCSVLLTAEGMGRKKSMWSVQPRSSVHWSSVHVFKHSQLTHKERNRLQLCNYTSGQYGLQTLRPTCLNLTRRKPELKMKSQCMNKKVYSPESIMTISIKIPSWDCGNA
jgi:hypothetical protein